MKEIKVTLNEKEEKEYIDFVKKHKKCREHSEDCLGNFYLSYKITPTGIGDIIKIKCEQCGEEKDITDIDSW